MELILLIGAQGAGKSTFYKNYLFNTHLRLSLDMMPRKRMDKLFTACLAARQRLVLDNTHPIAADRQPYIAYAKQQHFIIKGYYFDVPFEQLVMRNAQRQGKLCVPEVAIKSTLKKLEHPTFAEGFDQLFCVTPLNNNQFQTDNYHEI